MPVPDLLTSLFRAPYIPQPAGCIAGNALILRYFLDRGAEQRAKNALLAGKPNRRRRTGSTMIFLAVSGLAASLRGFDALAFVRASARIRVGGRRDAQPFRGYRGTDRHWRAGDGELDRR